MVSAGKVKGGYFPVLKWAGVCLGVTMLLACHESLTIECPLKPECLRCQGFWSDSPGLGIGMLADIVGPEVLICLEYVLAICVLFFSHI